MEFLSLKQLSSTRDLKEKRDHNFEASEKEEREKEKEMKVKKLQRAETQKGIIFIGL